MAAALYASMMTETAQTASATGITTSISSYVDCFFSVLVVCNTVHDQQLIADMRGGRRVSDTEAGGEI
jgi:hypothetical protein